MVQPAFRSLLTMFPLLLLCTVGICSGADHVDSRLVWSPDFLQKRGSFKLQVCLQVPWSCLVRHRQFLGGEKDLHQLQRRSSRLWLWTCGCSSTQAGRWDGREVLPTLPLQGGDEVGADDQGGGRLDHLGAGLVAHLPGLPCLPRAFPHWHSSVKGNWGSIPASSGFETQRVNNSTFKIKKLTIFWTFVGWARDQRQCQ